MITPIQQIYKAYLGCNGISTDSRTVQTGNLFFALKGPNFDGNRKATEAITKGAKYAVVDDPALQGDDGILIVDNVLKALQELARVHRRSFEFPVIAITGSNGKTTTKELLFSVLNTEFSVWCTQGNLNNHIGVPKTILSTPPNTNFLIVEMGANQPGDIKELCTIAEPDYGLITNVGISHLEGLHSIDGVYREKTQLFNYVERHGLLIFRNTDDQLLEVGNEWSKVVDYGSEKIADLRIDKRTTGKSSFLQFQLIEGTEQFLCTTNLIGNYNLQNCASAIAVANYFNIDIADIVAGIELYKPSNMRSQLIEKEGITIILDAYNANPSSMKASINSFTDSYIVEESIIVVGDMLELGQDSLFHHQQIIELMESSNLKYISIGEEFYKTQRNSGKAFKRYEDAEEALSDELPNHNKLLIKGSRGMMLERIVDMI